MFLTTLVGSDPMTPDRWNKIKTLFSSAQDCPEAERSAFLLRACDGDDELRKEVEDLLDADREDQFLENSAVAEAPSIFGDENGAGGEISVSDSGPPRFDTGKLLAGRYEVQRLLGRGGMGEVYLANDTRINRQVSLKVLHRDLVSNKESLRRFEIETQAVSALNHPHIMTIYELDQTEDGTLFFVAEYIDGQTLNRMIGADLDLDKALDIAIQVSTALSAAHAAGITHRDIKPENIMVRRDGYVKVLDFGLAKLTQRKQSSRSSGSEDPTRALTPTRPGTVMGTAAYMSPEQARGLDVDARTDIWSLGAVLYEMVTGRRPFTGETQADTMVAVLLSTPAEMSSYVSGLPEELDEIVSKALAKDVEGRYASANELRADLENIRKQIEIERSVGSSTGRDLSRGELRNRSSAGVGKAVPTSDDATRPTSGGRDESEAPESFWSSPSFASALRQAQGHKAIFSAGVLAVIALAASVAYFAFVAPSAGGRIDSIAVLPFDNLSGDPDLAYVSDGLSETLIDRLAQLPQLKVTARNSSFKFRGPNLDLRDVASQLGVRAIVTGSVTRVGDDLSIRVDVIDALEGTHLTGGQYTHKAGDLLRIQNDVARAAFEPLRLKLTDSQSKRLNDNATENSEAYRYYLSGLVELNGSQGVYGNALEYFERAVELDPDFSAALTEIAWIHWARANADRDPNKLVPKAKVAVERALEINPDLAKAHTVRAMLYEFEFDWPNAEREYKRSIELSPNLDFARNNYAFFLSVMGRQGEALAELEEQRIRDPINRRLMLLQRGIVLTQARKFDEALQAYQEAQAVEPTREIPSFTLGYAYGGKGLYGEAAGYYKRSVDLMGGGDEYSQPLVYLAATYARIPEKRDEARAMVARIQGMGKHVSPALLAIVYSALDDNDKAMELLEQAYIKRDLFLKFIGAGYEYDGLRNDPRFVDLTKRMGFSR